MNINGLEGNLNNNNKQKRNRIIVIVLFDIN